MLIKNITATLEKDITNALRDIFEKRYHISISTKWIFLQPLAIPDDKTLLITNDNLEENFFITKSKLLGLCINKYHGNIYECAKAITNQIDKYIYIDKDIDENIAKKLNLMRKDNTTLSSFISPVIHVNLPNSDKDILKDASEAFDNIFDAIEL